MSETISIRRIQQLTPEVANQIAAGEVIERPAAVVKELLENSLDAGATRIEIYIENGGIDKIQVVDNGNGIYPDDLKLAVTTHATSKVRSVDDLSAISSLGFRGEALASIFSVAKSYIISKHKSQDEAYKISFDNANNFQQALSGHPTGTTVSVSNLFYNVPARRAFLKRARTEQLHIEETIKKLALSSPHVSFILKTPASIVFNYPSRGASDLQTLRVKQVMGSAFITNAKLFEVKARDIKLSGWIARPEFSRSQSDMQYFYVNGRVVRDKLINHAIRTAYADSLFPGRYCAYVLYLQMPALAVDVNVHPTKHEVRFAQARWIHDYLTQSVKDALASFVPADCAQPLAQTAALSRSDWTQVINAAQLKQDQGVVAKAQIQSPTAKIGINKQPYLDNKSWFRLTNNFIVMPLAESEFIFINLHAVSAQISYNAFTDEAAKLASQPLLIPLSITVSKDEADKISDLQMAMQNLGVELDLISATSCLLRAVPAVMRFSDWSLVIKFMLGLNAGKTFDLEALHAISCFSLPKNHQALSDADILAILHFVTQADTCYTCSHQHKSWLKLREYELENMLQSRP